VESTSVASPSGLRAVAIAPDGTLWLTTSNRDQVGASTAAGEDDRILRISL
jgi:hypothetical protein